MLKLFTLCIDTCINSLYETVFYFVEGFSVENYCTVRDAWDTLYIILYSSDHHSLFLTPSARFDYNGSQKFSFIHLLFCN